MALGKAWGWTWVDRSHGFIRHFTTAVTVTLAVVCWWPGGYYARPVWSPALVDSSRHQSQRVGRSGPVSLVSARTGHRYRPHYPHNPGIDDHHRLSQTRRAGPPHRNHEGNNVVPGPRFRDPVMKVALPVRTNVAELQPMAPPPKNIAPVHKVAEGGGMVRRPNQVQPSPQAPASASIGRTLPTPSTTPAPTPKVSTPTRVTPPIVAEPTPNRGVTPQPPLPGNDPAPLAQPPKFNRVPPTSIQTQPLPPRSAAPEMARPQPRARSPQELLPQAEQNQRAAAEPPRFPPGAPPTIKQPKAPPVARTTPPAPQPAERASPPIARAHRPHPHAAERTPPPAADRNPRRARTHRAPKTGRCVRYRDRSRWCSTSFADYVLACVTPRAP